MLRSVLTFRIVGWVKDQARCEWHGCLERWGGSDGDVCYELRLVWRGELCGGLWSCGWNCRGGRIGGELFLIVGDELEMHAPFQMPGGSLFRGGYQWLDVVIGLEGGASVAAGVQVTVSGRGGEG